MHCPCNRRGPAGVSAPAPGPRDRQTTSGASKSMSGFRP
jgi:hypothetical protein